MTPRRDQLVHPPRPNLKTRILQPLGPRPVPKQILVDQPMPDGHVTREHGDPFGRVEWE